MKKFLSVCGAAAPVASLAGCESMGAAAQSQTNQGAVLGGLLGAGTGAVLGNQMGHHAGAGTAIGAGLGALGGGLIGHGMEEQSNRVQAQQYRPASTTVYTPAPGAVAAPSVTTTQTTGVKFCPVGGETYPDTMKYCPTHGVELKYKQDSAPSTTTTTTRRRRCTEVF